MLELGARPDVEVRVAHLVKNLRQAGRRAAGAAWGASFVRRFGSAAGKEVQKKKEPRGQATEGGWRETRARPTRSDHRSMMHGPLGRQPSSSSSPLCVLCFWSYPSLLDVGDSCVRELLHDLLHEVLVGPSLWHLFGLLLVRGVPPRHHRHLRPSLGLVVQSSWVRPAHVVAHRGSPHTRSAHAAAKGALGLARHRAHRGRQHRGAQNQLLVLSLGAGCGGALLCSLSLSLVNFWPFVQIRRRSRSDGQDSTPCSSAEARSDATFPTTFPRAWWPDRGSAPRGGGGDEGAQWPRWHSQRDTRPPESTAAFSRCAFRAFSVPSDRNRSPRGASAGQVSWRERLGRGGGGVRAVGGDPSGH